MARRTFWGSFFVLGLLFVLFSHSAAGQAVFGSIIGTVTDPQGSAVAGAKVTVTSTTKSTVFETTTNESGNYSVTHLIPDTYKVHVEAAGFKSYDVPSVSVSADSAASLDATMQVGSVTQSVEVSGDIPQLQTDRADVDVQFSQKYVEDLPILNRNFTNFELLSPGTQKMPGFSHAATENPQGGGQIVVNGQHFSGTNFELDGTDNQDPILGIIVVNPNLDAIAEAKIALQDYDAESGKATSGIVSVQTKSGSNELHGSGFYFYRSSNQEARDPFTNTPGVPLAAANWKQFGGSVGGAIIKDKLFFFGDYQGTKQIQGITNLYTIPTAQALQSCVLATNAASASPGFCNLSQYTTAIAANGLPIGSSGDIFDPLTGNQQTGVGRTQFCGPAGCATEPNWIPISSNPAINRVPTNVQNVLALLPAPTAGCPAPATVSCLSNNFVSTGSGPFDQKSFDTRIDYSAPHNYQIFGRFSLDYFSLSGLGGLGSLGGLGFGPGGLNGSSINHDYSLASGFTKAIGTRWLTDFRFGYFKYNPQTHYSDASQSPMDKLGFPGLNSGPGVVGAPETGGLSGFQFTQNGGGTGAGNGSLSSFGDGLNIGRCNCPLTESEQQFQFVNNWTYSRGNHSIKFGADIRYAENLRVPSDASRTGLLNFDSGATSDGGAGGLALGTFLLGDVTSFQRFVSTSLTAAERQKRWFFYGQDSWRISPKFTMTYGLRWEIYFPESVNAKDNGGFANLEQGVIRVAGNGPIGLNGNINNTLKAFAPRLSFAYQFDPKTVVRLGYGRGFDIGVFGSNFGHVVTQNLPVLAQQSLQDTNCSPQQQITCGPGTTNNRFPVFTLNQGPQAFSFAGILGDISSGGTLPLQGPDGTVQPRIRPTVQRLPTIDQWNATIQRQITPTLNITASYIGNKGTHVFAGTGPSYNNNEPAIGTGTDAYHCTANAAPGTGFDCKQGFAPSVSQSDRRRYFLNGVPAFTYPGSFFTDSLGNKQPTPACCAVDTGYFGNDADNKYNALQIKAEKRTSYGLQFIAHYTYSRAYAYDSNYFDVNKAVAWGPNPDNRNNVFVANTIYELPVGRGKKFLSGAGRAMDYAVGGWQVSNTLTWGSGLPWTPSLANCGQISDAGPCRPNKVGNQALATGLTKNSSGTFWFTPVTTLNQNLPEITNSPTDISGQNDSCQTARPTAGPFALPACGQIGNVGFDSYRGPHAFYDDMSISKNFTITERVKAQFRFDAYNVFNHPVLALPSNQCVDCAGAGQITDIEADAAPGSPVGMRQLQFGFRVTF
jgi:Carboxypeptidase regulatory-like domain